MFNLFKHELFSRWVSIIGWGVGLTAFASMYIMIYPSMASEMAALGDIEIYQAMGMDVTTFAGYIASIVIQILPIILGVYVIMMSTNTLAGEEDNGTLEMVVALPLERWQIVAMKALALLIAIFFIMVILGVGSAIVLNAVVASSDVTIDVEPMQLIIALLGSYPMMVAFFGMGLFFGAFMPSRRLALVVMFAIYIASYVANSASGMVESLNWMETISLFSYVNATTSVFTDGLDLTNMLILFAIGLVFIGLAMWSFQGRNITVGQWIWQRGQSPA